VAKARVSGPEMKPMGSSDLPQIGERPLARPVVKKSPDKTNIVSSQGDRRREGFSVEYLYDDRTQPPHAASALPI
jgi:hypothetical protein